MQSGQLLTPFSLLVLLCLVVGIVGVIRSRKGRRTSRRQALKQRLRNITIHDQAKTDRLIEFERTELIRKGRAKEDLDDLMERAIERWERDNTFATSIH
jgi:hypothetical protein